MDVIVTAEYMICKLSFSITFVLLWMTLGEFEPLCGGEIMGLDIVLQMCPRKQTTEPKLVIYRYHFAQEKLLHTLMPIMIAFTYCEKYHMFRFFWPTLYISPPPPPPPDETRPARLFFKP